MVIIKKEWVDIKSSFFSLHNLMAGIWPIFLFCVAFGVYEPVKIGSDWLQSPTMMFSVSVLIPFIAIGFISPYTFVGERIRGTLEPLLATPVSDRAILFGKIGTAVLYGLGVSSVNLLLGLVSINIFTIHGSFLFYPPGLMVVTILLTIFFSILFATIGTHSSYYAKTILDAQRKLVMVTIIPILFPAFFLGPLMPAAWKASLVQIITQLGTPHFLFILLLLLLLVDGLCLTLAVTHFHRKQLLLT
jgi:ABC-2 type transport system permease protein